MTWIKQNQENQKVQRDIYLSYSGLFLLELTEPQYFCSCLVIELMVEGMEQLDTLSKTTAKEIKDG